jgi:hypothetical protein
MSRSGTFLEAAVSYYSNLAFGALASMRSTQEDLRTGQFTLSKSLGGAVSFWLDASEGWWSALLVTASEPLPTVFLRVGPHGATDTQEVRVLVSGPPEFTGLSQIGGTERIDDKLINVAATQKGDGIEVKLKGISPDVRPPQGLYHGLVHIGSRPLAVVMVLIDPPAPDI